MVTFEGVKAKIGRACAELTSLGADMDRLCEDVKGSIVREVREATDEQVWIYRGEPTWPGG